MRNQQKKITNSIFRADIPKKNLARSTIGGGSNCHFRGGNYSISDQESKKQVSTGINMY